MKPIHVAISTLCAVRYHDHQLLCQEEDSQLQKLQGFEVVPFEVFWIFLIIRKTYTVSSR